MWGDIAIAFLLAFITAFMMTPYSIKLAKKVGAVDVPKDNRRMHHKPIPKLGGVAVIAGFVVSFIYLVITLSIEDSSRLNLFGIEEYGKKILGFFVGVLILGITCFIDDVKTIKPLAKLSGQLLAAIAVVVSGIRIIEVIPFFESAALNEAVSMILLHNHPSGDPEPSREDILVTKKIAKAGELIGITLMDHIIIGDQSYVSLAEKGWV